MSTQSSQGGGHERLPNNSSKTSTILAGSSTYSPISARESPVLHSSGGRRSVAHNPRILGLNGMGGIELRGLGLSNDDIESSHIGGSSKSHLPEGLSGGPKVMTLFDNGEDEEDTRFRIDEQEEGESLDIDNEKILHPSGQQSVQGEGESESKRKPGRPVLAPIRTDGDILNNNVELQGIKAVQTYADGEDEAEVYEREIEDTVDSHLLFEPTTARERAWMWTSIALVLVLTIVSIAIAVDWIDWPGDGIGKN